MWTDTITGRWTTYVWTLERMQNDTLYVHEYGTLYNGCMCHNALHHNLVLVRADNLSSCKFVDSMLVTGSI